MSHLGRSNHWVITYAELSLIVEELITGILGRAVGRIAAAIASPEAVSASSLDVLDLIQTVRVETQPHVNGVGNTMADTARFRNRARHDLNGVTGEDRLLPSAISLLSVTESQPDRPYVGRPGCAVSAH